MLTSQVFEVIAGLVEAFCREHLNDEYADLCRRLRDAGLDEIRFDLGAVEYNLNKVSMFDILLFKSSISV